MKTSLMCVSLAAAAAAASGSVLDVQFVGNGAGQSVLLTNTLTGDQFATFAGELQHQISGAPSGFEFLDGIIRTFCIDPSEPIARSMPRKYTIENLEDLPFTSGSSNPMGALKANAIRALLSDTADDFLANTLTNVQASAIQLTIWEIVVDFDGSASSIDVSAGDLIATRTNGNALGASVLSQISSLSAQLVQALADDNLFQGVIGLGNPGFQDQIVIPAPAGLAMLGLGGLAAARRRR